MSDIKQTVIFPGSGLDSDSSNHFMALGDSPYRLHIIVGVEGSNGVIENMKGNSLATYTLNKSHTYQVVGSHYNQLTRKCYYFLFSQPYDSDGSGDYLYDNHLLEYDEDLKTIKNIFTDEANYFGLDPRYPVKDCNMLGDMLYFNPRISEPKVIDVRRAFNYTSPLHPEWQPSPKTYLYGDKVRFFGGIFVANKGVAVNRTPATHPLDWDRDGDCYQDQTDLDFDSEFRYAFNVIRHIPVKRPDCVYASDTTKNANQVRGKLFRFTQRYKYFDDTYSLYGAYSDVVLPVNDEYYNGEVPDNINLYNYISVGIPLHSATLVKEIDLIFQETGGDWKRATIIHRQEQGLLDDNYYTYKFYNTGTAYEVIPQDSTTNFSETYDSVPKKAATQELINKNILAYGRCTEGFNNIDKNDIQVSLTPEIETITIPESSVGRRRDNVASGDWTASSGAGGLTLVRLDFTSWYSTFGMATGDIYVMTVGGLQATYTVQAADVVSIDTFVLAIATFMQNAFPTIADKIFSLAPTIKAVQIQTMESFPLGMSVFYEPSGTAQSSIAKYKGWKTGSWQPLCLFYYDKAMRRCDAQTSKDNIDMGAYQIEGTSVYVPMLNEMSPVPVTGTANRFKVNWAINHLPPLWAKWWRWGFAGNALCTYFVQYVINAVVDKAPWTTIDISPLQTLSFTAEVGWNQFPKSSIIPYVWEVGDRVRLITEKESGSAIGALVEGVYDFEIVKYEYVEATTAPVAVAKYLIYTQDFDFSTLNVDSGSIIEIYKPIKTTSAQVFYEFGELMPIIEDSAGVLVHGVGILGTENQDFATSTPASGTFNGGDIYHILRTPSKPISTIANYFHESQWYSDFYDSDDWDKGRIGVETSFGERTLNIIRHSNQYLQNTGINGLSTFEGNSYKMVSDMFGKITSMVEVGTTLKVYMEKKSASILIGRQEYVDDKGNITIASSDVVLGSIRYPENNFGTQFIESVSKSNRYTYGFDIFNAVMWRDSANGLFPISGRYEEAGQQGDYKMASWFKAKATAMMLSGIENLQIPTVWDEKYKMLYVIFKDNANNANNETIVYHEPSNRWITFAEFDQTPVVGYNVMLELDYSIVKGFENGIGYWFNEDTRFAMFNIGGGSGTGSGVNIALDNFLSITFELPDPTVTILNVPLAPVATGVTSQNPTGFIGNWNQSIGATGYRVDISSSWNFISFIPGYEDLDLGNVLSITVVDMPSLYDYYYYYYRVRAYNDAGISGNSNMIETYTLPMPPFAPIATAAESIRRISFQATWIKSVTPSAIQTWVDVATDAGFLNILPMWNNASAGTANSLEITNLAPLTTYYYRVRGDGGATGMSPDSNIITVTTLDTPNVPIALQASNISYTSFQLNWMLASGATGYKFDVSRYADFSLNAYDDLYSVDGATSKFVDYLQPGTTYYYRIRSWGAGGTSVSSNVITVTTLATPINAISVSPSSWNFGGNGAASAKEITVTTTGTSWGVIFPSLNNYIHVYSAQAGNKITLYYTGTNPSGDTLQFYSDRAGQDRVYTPFTGRWI
jgi:hypothetical protein